MSDTLKVVTLLGSLRKGSFNGMVARTLPGIAPAGMDISALPSIGDIPLYDADIYAGGRRFSAARAGDCATDPRGGWGSDSYSRI